jgi:hypothetical protein
MGRLTIDKRRESCRGFGRRRRRFLAARSRRVGGSVVGSHGVSAGVEARMRLVRYINLMVYKSLSHSRMVASWKHRPRPSATLALGSPARQLTNSLRSTAGDSPHPPSLPVASHDTRPRPAPRRPPVSCLPPVRSFISLTALVARASSLPCPPNRCLLDEARDQDRPAPIA